MLLSSQSSFLGFFFLSSVCHGVAGQSFTIPSTWQNTTSSLSRTDRAQIARDAIGQLAPLIDSATGTIDSALTTLNATASLFASFALNDWITGDTTYKSIVVSNVPTFLGLQPDLGVASDSAIWGLTAYYTFRAYNDSSFLHTATNAWDYASRHLITDAQVGAGSHPTRDFELPTQCNGSSVAGGVFSTEDSSDGAVNGETVGPFLALSAYLAEATSNSTYSSAAELSAAFIRDHLFNGTVVSYDFDVKACQVSAADFVFTHDSGFAIEGYSVLGNATKNNAWTALAESLVATSVPFPAWTNPDGVIAEDDKTKLSKVKNGFKRIFVRALHEVWLRSDPDSDIAKFIASFLTIQFNSIQANAKIPGSNAYSPFWDGPAFEKLHAVSQVIALYALNSAIDIVQPASNGTASGSSPSPSSSPSTSLSPSPSARSSSSSHVGAIVGGVVGGVVGTVLVIAGTVILLWSRSSRRPLLPRDESQAIDPFISHLLSTWDSSVSPTTMISSSGKRTAVQPTLNAQSRSMSTDPTTSRRSNVPPESQGRSRGVETMGEDFPVLVRRVLEGVMTQIRLGISPSRDEAPPPQYEG